MSYALEITFTGMCGFVPVDDADQRAVHVLFPATTRADAHGPVSTNGSCNGHGAMDVHVSRLLFDISALSPGAEQPARWPAVVSLQNRELEFAGEGGLDLNLTSFLAPLRYLKPGFLGDKANDYIATRVVLRSGAQARASEGAVWLDQEGEERPMSHRLTWRIEGLTEPLRLTMRSLVGKLGETLPPLYPDATGKLALFVYHVLPEEVPPEPYLVPEPAPGDEAHHFAALNLLVTEPVLALPRFVRITRSPIPGDPGGFERGFVPFNCMGAVIQYAEGA